MDHPLLTIIVPTYNRAQHLRALLDVLLIELKGVHDQVNVIIGDNASTDQTPEVIHSFSSEATSGVRVLRHASNVGPDENFCRCVEAVSSPYFWIIGDDDLPRAGALSSLLKLLQSERPDLVYLCSSWSETLEHNSPDNPIPSPLNAVRLDRSAFARRVHVWSSFISGCIVSRSLAPDPDLRRYTGTNLVQLGWVLGAICHGRRFIVVKDPTVFATAGNTGGYSVLKVFGQNFQRITRDVFSQDHTSRQVGELIVRRTSLSFLPDLVWGFRQARLGKFDQSETVESALEPQLGKSLIYRWVILPVAKLPEGAARVALKGAHTLARLLHIYDAVHVRLRGAQQQL